MPKMPVMEAAVKIMESEGVDVCFGIPGAAILPAVQGAIQVDEDQHLTMRHEEGATHAADGWARITGKVGVAIGTSGPAGTNMVTGLYTCMADSIPIVCITGQALKGMLHKEAFQAVNIAEIVKPVVKKSYLRPGGRADPAGLSRGLPHRAGGSPRAGADRPATGRAAGRGRVRSRHRRAAGGVQALPGCPQDPAGHGDAAQAPSGRS